jgi:hypothetical protein
MVAPLKAKKYKNGRWDCTAKCPYQNYPCTFKKCGEHPNALKPIALAPLGSGFASSAMQRML